MEFPQEEIERSIPDRFEKIVRLYPDRIAVSTLARELTYAELNAWANRLAYGLLEKQKGSSRAVALLMEPNDLAIAAVIGVLKARKIYIPLDPSYPRGRLLSVLDDSGAGMVLTDQKNLGLATELTLGARMCINADGIGAGVTAENPVIVTSASDPVTIFYTSGSTGQPKGVVQNHTSVLHRIMSDTNTFHTCSDDRLSLLSSPAYSVSLRNLFGALLNGAAVCPFDAAGDGLRQLESWLLSQRITIYFSVPTVFRQLVANLRQDAKFNFLRLIYLGGESVSKEDVESYKRCFAEAILVNSLASNEAGIIAYYFLDKDSQESENIPAGYSVEGKELLILGEEGEDVGVGRVGEIALRSRFLSPGYWQNGIVADFALNGNLQDGKTPVYRTEDLGYLRDDGCLIHLGRKGLRVKIRGSRVELEEVEAALRQHPAVRNAVVDAVRDGLEGDRLIAYVVLRDGQCPTITELRDDLLAKLARYMIPSSFVFLAALPLTPNGKVDRLALPVPDKSRPQLKAAYAPPTTAKEVFLVQMWSKMLSVDQIGIHDNFFDLGGNSLLAAVLVARINRDFEKALSISVFYEGPTIAQLAKALNREMASHARISLVSLQPHGSKLPFFWIHGQASDGLIAGYFRPDQPVYGLIHQSMDGKPAAHTTVESIAAHYLSEIRTVQPLGPYLLGGYCFGGVVAFEMAQQLKKQNEETSLLFLLDPPNGIALSATATPKPDTSIYNQVYQHKENFKALAEPRKKVRYVLSAAIDLIKTLLRPSVNLVIRVTRNLLIRTFVKFGKPIPVRLRIPYILDVYEYAMGRYTPTVYSGRLTIFKAANDRRNPETWSHLAAKGVEIHVIPGNHENILREPYLGVWVEKLKAQILR